MPRRGWDALNDALDRLARPEIRACGRTLPAFQVGGVTGFLLAFLLVQGLACLCGLSHGVLAATALAAVLTFFAHAFLTLIVTGREQLVYYRHEVAVLIVVALLLRCLGQPVLPYLEVTLLGVGLFLAGGRFGCLMVGCCHGRPHRVGVQYGEDHARAGLPHHLVGVRLFPVQAVESLLALGIVAAGSAIVLLGRPPGEALGLYTACYGVGRFGLEFARGDADRAELLGFTEAQWWSLVLTGMLAASEVIGIIPLSYWHLVAAAGIAVAMVAIAADRRRRLFGARHIEEIAAAVSALYAPGAPKPLVTQTSSGLRIATGTVGNARHVSMSCAGAPLTEAEARRVADLIRRLTRESGPGQLVAGSHGVYHWIASAAAEQRVEAIGGRQGAADVTPAIASRPSP